MAYAYSDKHGILHIVEKMDTALNSVGQGNVVETNYPHENGYPKHQGKSIFVYVEKNEAYIGGNTQEKGKTYKIKDDFALAEIVRKIKGE